MMIAPASKEHDDVKKRNRRVLSKNEEMHSDCHKNGE